MQFIGKALINDVSEIEYLRKEVDQLTNNWNELEEWLKEQKEDANKCIEWNKNKNQYYDEYKRDIARFDFILDKMKEIKENTNN